jgi:hypothetical protein
MYTWLSGMFYGMAVVVAFEWFRPTPGDPVVGVWRWAAAAIAVVLSLLWPVGIFIYFAVALLRAYSMVMTARSIDRAIRKDIEDAAGREAAQ